MHLFNMKEKFLLILAIFLTAFSVAKAQEIEEPDYHVIRQAVQNSKGPNYYPNLMRRYIQNDSTLTLEQYRNLYYGYTLQEDFVPYKTHKTQLLDMRRRFTEAKGDSKLGPEVIRIAKAQLDDNPFDIQAINLIAVSYLQMGDTLQYHLWDIKQKGLLDAILSSGDGAEASTSFHVIDVEHEYEVLNRLGLQIESDSLVNSEIEYLKVKENAEGEKGFFFNFGACSKVYKKKYE